MKIKKQKQKQKQYDNKVLGHSTIQINFNTLCTATKFASDKSTVP